MKPLLILTKNILFEQKLQNNLQTLNYEVFCSKILFEKLLHRIDITQIDETFAGIIISDTINDEEARQLISEFRKNNLFFRKVSTIPNETERDRIDKLGVDGWISDNSPLDQLREYLVTILADVRKGERQKTLVFSQHGELIHKEIQTILHVLSNKEKIFFQKLIDSNGEIVSRVEMSQAIWGEIPNNSHLAQMSILVKRIRWKLKELGIEEDIIETTWGKGYRLNQSRFENETTENEYYLLNK